MPTIVKADLLSDEDGNPEQRFLPVDVVVVPTEVSLSLDQSTIEVSDEEAYWYGIGDEKEIRTTCLTQFIQLSERPATRILQFAQRWGLLGLCIHGLPASHNLERRDIRERSVMLPYEGCTPEPTEKVSDWRNFSVRFRTIVEVAQSLHRGQRITDDSVWEKIGRPRRSFIVGKAMDSALDQNRRLARAVNLHLAASGIQPVVHWNRDHPTIGFGVFAGIRTTLFAALTMQLAMTISDCKIAICSSCHGTYVPKRRTHAHQSNYCPACRANGVDVRRRVQRLRDRRRDLSRK